MRTSSIVMALCVASASAFLSPTVLRASARAKRANTIVEAELTRRETLFAGAAGVLSLGLAPGSASAKKLSYKEVSNEIKAIVKADPDKGPTLVRLAWHASGTYDKMSKDGGSNGGTIRFTEELAHGANAGLPKAVGWLEPIKEKHGALLSYADLYTLSGVAAIEAMGGPSIGWRAGRVDARTPAAVTPDGRLPAADKGSPDKTAAGLREVFGRMGFDDREIVALSGAHALGRCHPDASGYTGPWTATPTLFTNGYFQLLKNVKWTPKKWDGPAQYEDPSGKLMMLPSDLLLLSDKGFAPYVDTYAKDAGAFFADFAAAFQKLEELGTSGLVAVDI